MPPTKCARLMRRHSSEAYLLSALITTGDVLGAERRGIVPTMFAGYQAEYRWLLSYQHTYGEAPSAETMLQRFPAFRFTENTDVRFSADEVREEHNRRELAKAVRGTAEYLRQGDLESALIEWGGFSLDQSGAELTDGLADASFLEFYDTQEEVLSMPWPSLTNLTSGGIRPGEYWVFAARLGVGKSWTNCVVAANAIQHGKDAVIYSLEMPKHDVHQRMHALLAPSLGFDVTFEELRSHAFPRRKYKLLLEAIKSEVPGNFFVVDSSSGPISPATVAAHANKAELHMIDYIGLMRDVAGTRAVADWRVAAAVSNELKEISTAKSTRVLALSQLNRDGDNVRDWRPASSRFLSQADAIGQDADGVVTMKKYSATVMTYLLDKSRSGPSDRYFWTRFDPNTAAFEEISRARADAIKDQEMDDAD